MTDAEREAWLQERRQGIGASEIAAVCGLSPYADDSPFEVYLGKVGVRPARRSDPLYFGHLLEPVAAAVYAEREGATVVPPRAKIIRHPTIEFVAASLDREVIAPRKKILECKNARYASPPPDAALPGGAAPELYSWGPAGTEQIPLNYYYQAQWQLLACAHLGLDEVDVAVLLGGSEFRAYTIRPNPDVQAALIERGAAFWDKVKRRDPSGLFDPTLPGAARLLNLARPPRRDEEVALGPRELGAVEAWEVTKKQIKTLEALKEQLEATLTAACGDAEWGLLPDGSRIRRQLVVVPERPVPAKVAARKEYVLLSRKKAKEEG